MANEFSIDLRVYIEDTDAGGVVFYVNYLKYMERARTEYLRSLGFPKPALLSDELITVVASANIDYKKSAVLDDKLVVTADIERVASAFIIFRQQVRRESESGQVELLADAQIKIACVNRLTARPARFPAELRTAVTADIGNKQI
jgi:4-hydroxybenzoyl-CoA thioesterase/acyl-CoA thioester hydrolase